VIVIDASATLAWCFKDEETPDARTLLARVANSGAHVPSLWTLEVANSLHFALRRGRMSEAIMTEKIKMLCDLPVTIHELHRSQTFGPVSSLARQHALTIYDASYFELAIRLRAPFATRDTALQNAARLTGVELVAA
jgi:predicted nucleic acid-binding protein